MKNLLFIFAGLSLVMVILVATLLHVPVDETVVYEPPVTTPDVTEEIPEVIEPVAPAEEITNVKVYFGNSEQDPNAERCEQVYAVDRTIEPTLAVAKESLDQLLAGVTVDENKQGYFSSLNEDARVVSIAIENGIATVVFSEEFAVGLAGSCKVTSVRAQVEETLKQFTSVKEVIIKIEGLLDDEVLQP